MLQREELIELLIKNVMGEDAISSQYEETAVRAFEMGLLYAKTKRFDNSKYYHNYQFCLDDGSKISSTSYFNQFMSRNQTHAYMEAEQAVREFFDDERDVLFHLVRDQRFGINGIFKAVMSPSEPQQITVNDFILITAAFCCGVMSFSRKRS